METVTVAADRIAGVTTADMGMLIGIALVVVGVVWMVLVGVKRHQRHQPHA